MPKFNGTEGGIIPISTARSYISNYVNGPTFKLNLEIKAHYFGRDLIDDLLDQTGAVGLRMYYGFKQNAQSLMEPELIIVAVDEDGNDILINDQIVDVSRPCPPACATSGL